jgi:exosortase
MVSDWWTDPSASHGLVVLPFALGIAWVGRARTLAEPAEPGWWGLSGVLAGCVLLLLAKLGAEAFLMRCSLLVVAAGLVWTFWGWRRLTTLGFPFLLLLTMIPVPALLYNQVAIPLQLAASGIAAAIAQSLGVIVYRDGNIIYLANISLGITEACSGLRSLFSLLVLALVFGHLQRQSWRRRLVLLAMAFPIAVVVNVVRIVGTALIADHDARYAMGFFHVFSGWLVFIAGMIVLWAATLLLQRLAAGRVNP